MMYEEFISLSGATNITIDTYNEIVEPAYMECELFTNKYSFVAFFKSAGLNGCVNAHKLAKDKKRTEEENKKLKKEKAELEDTVKAAVHNINILEQKNAEYRNQIHYINRQMQFRTKRY